MRLSALDFYFHTAGELELHQGVDDFGCSVVDVNQTLVAAEFELLAALLVDEGRAVDCEDAFVRGRGMGPLITAPIDFTVFTIFSADLSTRLWS